MDSKNILQEKIDMIIFDASYCIEKYQENHGDAFSYNITDDLSRLLWYVINNCHLWDEVCTFYDNYVGAYNEVHILGEHVKNRIFITIEEDDFKMVIDIYESDLLEGYDEENVGGFSYMYGIKINE
ncbi:MAG: hypothetical protein J6Q61_02855 [Bacteroidales bacterium]|nr:hypothetical protein [Bacteroidales bacterium]MBO5853656.1 hypothetical protein [Bacteroidales bacterium]